MQTSACFLPLDGLHRHGQASQCGAGLQRASGSSLHPAVRYTGRLATDALNTMQAEASIVEGGGSQTGSNLARWGDCSAMTIWFTSEYIQSNGAIN